MSCQLGKQSALPFNKSTSIESVPFSLVHSDVWGPASIPTMGGSCYFVIFVDDFSRFTWIYLFHKRSELFGIYEKFSKMVKTQFSKEIKILRSDNAREYTDKKFQEYLRQNGTLSQYSCPGTSQQNGRAERKHRQILNSVRSLLLSAKLPESLWGEAALTAVYTINRTPSSVLSNHSPYERLHGTPPNYSNLRVFGSSCFVLLHPHERNKLQPRSHLCCFLGYSIEHKGYRCYDPISKRLRISRHVVFWEHKPFTTLSSLNITPQTTTSFFTNPSVDLFPPENLIPETTSPDDPCENVDHTTTDSTTTTEPLRRSTRVSEPSTRLKNYHCYFALATIHEPRSFREASSHPSWQAAMTEELSALEKTQTWDLVELPPGKSVVSCKWVYKVKTLSDGTIDRYKARLVARGFTQEYGIDYEETFAPVARLTTVRTLIALATVRRWKLFQMDVKNAFLNGDLKEEVYMQPPPGLDCPPGKVCKLRKALYGLKQAPRAWFSKFNSAMKVAGFQPSPYDYALFLRQTSRGTTVLLLYVDDMVITGDDIIGIQELKTFLTKQFEMKDLGNLSYFLGIEVTSSDGYFLSQTKYTSDLLSRAGITDNKTADTPLESNAKHNSEGELLKNPTLYRQLVGSLIYLTVTRPDISYAVHFVSRFMSAPCSSHYAAVLRILRYLKGTIYHGLHYSSNSSLELRACSDSDWAGNPIDRRSITGYCFFLGDSLISWKSKRQTVVSRSSSEAEYRALADTTAELLWLQRLLQGLGVPSSSTKIYCDSQSAIQIAHNDVFHERTKHIEIDCHFTRHHLQEGSLQLCSIGTLDQPADIFTKSLSSHQFLHLRSKLKLVSTAPP